MLQVIGRMAWASPRFYIRRNTPKLTTKALGPSIDNLNNQKRPARGTDGPTRGTDGPARGTEGLGSEGHSNRRKQLQCSEELHVKFVILATKSLRFLVFASRVSSVRGHVA